MIEPKEIEINGKKYIISRIPAVAGREIITQYPLSNIPKIGNYEQSEALMFKLMKFVAVPLENGVNLTLDTPDLIDNHVKDAVTLLKLEKAMLQYNFDFLADGEISTFLNLVMKVADQKLTGILTALSGVSLKVDEQPSTN